MNRARIQAVMRKEFWHILRDWQSLVIVIVMPLVMMFLYGYALSNEIREIPVIVEMPNPSPEAQQIVKRLDATTLFRVIGIVPAALDVKELFRANRAKAVIRLTPDFAQALRRHGSPAPVQVVIDGGDQNLATVVRNTITPLLQTIVLDIMQIEKPKIVTVEQRVLYNPRQESAQFFVPGLMSFILLMISAMLTSVAITREKESGTLEQLLISPLKPLEILTGKILPYIVLATIDGILILIVGWLVFNVHVSGNLAFLGLVCLVYVFVALAMGLIFSTIAKNQQEAMMMVLPATLMPSMLLSGFIFPIASMPVPLQWVAHIIPATYFLEIIRGIILKGTGPAELWLPLCILAGIGVLFMGIAVKKFGTTS